MIDAVNFRPKAGVDFLSIPNTIQTKALEVFSNIGERAATISAVLEPTRNKVLAALGLTVGMSSLLVPTAEAWRYATPAESVQYVNNYQPIGIDPMFADLASRINPALVGSAQEGAHSPAGGSQIMVQATDKGKFNWDQRNGVAAYTINGETFEVRPGDQSLVVRSNNELNSWEYPGAVALVDQNPNGTTTVLQTASAAPQGQDLSQLPEVFPNKDPHKGPVQADCQPGFKGISVAPDGGLNCVPRNGQTFAARISVDAQPTPTPSMNSKDWGTQAAPGKAFTW